MRLPKISNAEELADLVDEIGLLPFFRCDISGFSLEECTPLEYWFVDGVEGPWQWREKIAVGGKIAYAKLFNKKAGFVSMKYYSDLCNYRRDGYDFDARYEDGLATQKCKRIVDAISEQGQLLSTEIKKHAGFGEDGLKGFETAMTILQMQTYITVREFVYKQDRYGNPYGWGIGRYALPELLYREHVIAAYNCKPSSSKDKLTNQIARICPQACEKDILKLIR